MDIERTRHTGWIEVICGSMFSGKSEELIRRLRRAQIARQKVQIFKPKFDNRYGEDEIVSHSEMRIPSRNVGSSADLLAQVDDNTEVVGIDEGQFFDDRPARGLQHAGEPRQARHRGRARPGLPGQAVRADAAAAGDRGVHHQDAGHLHGVRQPGQPHAAPGREQRPAAAGRAGHLRGALPRAASIPTLSVGRGEKTGVRPVV